MCLKNVEDHVGCVWPFLE